MLEPKLTKIGLVCVLAATAVGCDGTLEVQGTVVSVDGDPIEDCVLVLIDLKRNTTVRTRIIASRFDETFVIGGVNQEYRVKIRCDGYGTFYESEVLVSDAEKGTIYDPIDLGEIVIDK